LLGRELFAMVAAVAARRLPVIQTPAGEDADAAERPAWRWLIWGVVLTIVLFLPVSMLAVALGQRLARVTNGPAGASALIAGLPVLAAFAFAAWGAGAVVGRFGIRTTKRTAPAAGAIAALALVVFGAAGWGAPLVVALLLAVLLVLVGALLAWFGARFGRRRRR
jgi:hypothetical protein